MHAQKKKLKKKKEESDEDKRGGSGALCKCETKTHCVYVCDQWSKDNSGQTNTVDVMKSL